MPDDHADDPDAIEALEYMVEMGRLVPLEELSPTEQQDLQNAIGDVLRVRESVEWRQRRGERE